MKFNTDDPLFLKIVAVIVAIGLFIFVANETRQNELIGANSTSFTSSEIISDVPVTPIVEDEKYFVTGVPDTASVQLVGSQALLTQTIVAQNFRVVTPNLNALGEGRHEIDLEVEGVPDDLDYSVSPSSITVTIEEQVTESFKIQAEIDSDKYLADGYEIDQIDLYQETAILSGSASTMENVDQVIAVVQPDETSYKDDFTTVANLLVLDENGQPLDVNIEPKQVQAEVSVSGTTAEVPIELNQVGSPVPGYEYNISLANRQESSVQVIGELEAINSLNVMEVDVDISGITESTEKTVPLVLPDGVYQADLDKVRVNIEVTKLN